MWICLFYLIIRNKYKIDKMTLDICLMNDRFDKVKESILNLQDKVVDPGEGKVIVSVEDLGDIEDELDGTKLDMVLNEIYAPEEEDE